MVEVAGSLREAGSSTPAPMPPHSSAPPASPRSDTSSGGGNMRRGEELEDEQMRMVQEISSREAPAPSASASSWQSGWTPSMQPWQPASGSSGAPPAYFLRSQEGGGSGKPWRDTSKGATGRGGGGGSGQQQSSSSSSGWNRSSWNRDDRQQGYWRQSGWRRGNW